MVRPGPFSKLRRQRRDEKDLGHGLWRQTHDRFQRSLDRYWQLVDLNAGAAEDAKITPVSGSHTISQEELNGLVHAGNILTDLLPRVRALCLAGHAASAAGKTGEDAATAMNIPGEFIDTHRYISKASNDLATTAQTVGLFRRGHAEIASVGRQAEKVIEAIEQAEAAAPGAGGSRAKG